jgi:DNA-binding transcriptional ArsR family regulator
MPTITDGASGWDYDAEETLVVSDRAQMRALANEARVAIVSLLREQARSTQQLATEMGIPKGTIGHHLKTLERAGLVRVVRTRQVRAVTEKFYGRTARLFLFQAEDPADDRALGGSVLRQVAAEVEQAGAVSFGHVRARLQPKDRRRLERRMHRLMDDFMAAESPDGEPYALASAMYERPGA